MASDGKVEARIYLQEGRRKQQEEKNALMDTCLHVRRRIYDHCYRHVVLSRGHQEDCTFS